VRGIVITHGHEDHTGAIRHVLEEIKRQSMPRRSPAAYLKSNWPKTAVSQKPELNTVQAGDTVEIGPFKVEFFTSAIPFRMGSGWASPPRSALVVHSGDYKFDHTPVDDWPTDYAKLAEFSQRGVLALLADSTNAERLAGRLPNG
jgi:ribonuclease J